MPSTLRHPTLFKSYGERSEDPDLTPLATYLLRLMDIKQTNLCVSADVSTSAELLNLAEIVGDQICVLKTHADIVNDFSDKTMRALTEVSRRRKFVLFEDRKLGDIGNTVQQQYTSGATSIVRWAHIVNAHLFPGPSIIPAISEGARKAIAAHNTSVQTDISASPSRSSSDEPDADDDSEESSDSDHELNGDAQQDSEIEEDEDRARTSRKHSAVSVSTTISTQTEAISPQPPLRHTLSRSSTEDTTESDLEDQAIQLEDLGPPPFYRSMLLLAQMSSKDNFLTPDYTAACVKHARMNKDFVMGFIAQEPLNSEQDDNFITMTPGVQLAAGGDKMGQQYNTPEKVIGSAGCDVMIVGRGILGASDRRRAAHEYRRQGWMAYEKRLRAARGSKK